MKAAVVNMSFLRELLHPFQKGSLRTVRRAATIFDLVWLPTKKSS